MFSRPKTAATASTRPTTGKSSYSRYGCESSSSVSHNNTTFVHSNHYTSLMSSAVALDQQSAAVISSEYRLKKEQLSAKPIEK